MKPVFKGKTNISLNTGGRDMEHMEETEWEDGSMREGDTGEGLQTHRWAKTHAWLLCLQYAEKQTDSVSLHWDTKHTHTAPQCIHITDNKKIQLYTY